MGKSAFRRIGYRRRSDGLAIVRTLREVRNLYLNTNADRWMDIFGSRVREIYDQRFERWTQ